MWPVRFDPNGDLGHGIPWIRAGDAIIVTEHIDWIAWKIKISTESVRAMTYIHATRWYGVSSVVRYMTLWTRSQWCTNIISGFDPHILFWILCFLLQFIISSVKWWTLFHARYDDSHWVHPSGCSSHCGRTRHLEFGWSPALDWRLDRKSL